MKFWTVDSFTNQTFKGNPAGVCILNEFADSEFMQQIASEINLSETAFIVPKGNAQYDLRWFTPATEVELCGHATLAAAHILWHEMNVLENIIHFNTLSGVLLASRMGNEITLDFPAYNNQPIPVTDELSTALGIAPVCVHKAHDDWIIELPRFSDVVDYQPNITNLNKIDCRGIIITAAGKEQDQYDFVSRFFAPRVGVAEDPVTGSAHCKLAPYWAERLGKNEMIAFQASKRGGVVKVRVENNRVHLTGEAITVIAGDFLQF